MVIFRACSLAIPPNTSGVRQRGTASVAATQLAQTPPLVIIDAISEAWLSIGAGQP